MTSNIPKELTQLNQWICWRHEKRRNRPTKVPYQRGGRARADVTNPTTWSTFAEVCECDATNGLGFVFTPDDPYVGIDLDNCLDGDTLAPWASDLLASLPPTYTEVSPSGRGLKLWVRGELPPGHRNRRKIEGGEIEVYDTGRYFTVTGERYGASPSSVASADLRSWYSRWFPVLTPAGRPLPSIPVLDTPQGFDGPDDLMIRKIRRSASREKFERLWAGHIDAYGDDHSAADQGLCNILAFWCGPDPERIDRVFRQSGLYRDKWNREDYRDRTIDGAIRRCNAFYTRRSDDRPPEQSPVFDRAASGFPHRLSDTGNAERLVGHFGDVILYCSESAMWYVYDGTRWVQDHGGRIIRMAIETVRAIGTEADMVTSDGSGATNPAELAEALKKHAAKSEAESRIMAMVRLARAMRPVRAEDFDRDPWLLNTTNGTVDLRTGILRPASPADKITHKTTCGYHSGVTAPQWCAFVRWAFCGDIEMADYVQELLGMCISGDITEQVLPVFYGDGANGKSTLLDTIMEICGTYAGKAPPDLLMAKRGESHPTEVADLMGKRLVVASETEEGRRLRTSFVKEATGDREMKARFMRGNFFTFQRTHKLLLATNHKPRITEGKYSMWRRLRLVPFAATVGDAAQDKRLGEKLMTEAPGILAWLVAGCRRWYESGGFDEPAAVREATEEYREEEDPIAEFVEACLDLKAGGFAQRKDIRRAYVQWCRDSGVERPLAERAMISRIENQPGVSKSAQRVEGRSVRGLSGVSLSERCALGGGTSYE